MKKAARIAAALLPVLLLCACGESGTAVKTAAEPAEAVQVTEAVQTPSPTPTPAPTPVPVITADDLGNYDSVAYEFFGPADLSYDLSGRSSTLSRAEFWEEEYMELTFKSSGKTYIYANVSYSEFMDFMEADDVGDYYREVFKGNSDYFIEGYK